MTFAHPLPANERVDESSHFPSWHLDAVRRNCADHPGQGSSYRSLVVMRSALLPLPQNFRFAADFPLCCLSVPFETFLARLGWSTSTWHEPGLGKMRGTGFLLDDGIPVFIDESLQSIHKGTLNVSVEAGDLVRLGPEALVTIICGALDIESGFVSWKQDETGIHAARNFLEAVANHRAVQSDAG